MVSHLALAWDMLTLHSVCHTRERGLKPDAIAARDTDTGALEIQQLKERLRDSLSKVCCRGPQEKQELSD